MGPAEGVAQPSGVSDILPPCSIWAQTLIYKYHFMFNLSYPLLFYWCKSKFLKKVVPTKMTAISLLLRCGFGFLIISS